MTTQHLGKDLRTGAGKGGDEYVHSCIWLGMAVSWRGLPEWLPRAREKRVLVLEPDQKSFAGKLLGCDQRIPLRIGREAVSIPPERHLSAAEQSQCKQARLQV